MQAHFLGAGIPRKCVNIKSLDFFGERVQFTFQKSPYFQTNIGAVFSIVCMILMFSFLTIRTMKLAHGIDPFFSSTSLTQENEIDLLDLGLAFAIENVDPSVGTVFTLFHQMEFTFSIN